MRRHCEAALDYVWRQLASSTVMAVVIGSALTGCEANPAPPPTPETGEPVPIERPLVGPANSSPAAIVIDAPAEERPSEGAAPAAPAAGTRGDSHFGAADRRFALRARTAVQAPGDSVVRLAEVHLVMYDSSGTEVGSLTADRGEYDARTAELVARGNVIVDVPGGDRRLRTEELHYRPDEERIWSPVRSRLERPGLLLDVERFSADSGFRTFESWGARGTFTLERGDP